MEFQGRYLTEMTIRVICGTPLTPTMIRQILTVLESSIPRQMVGQISSVSCSSMPLEVLH